MSFAELILCGSPQERKEIRFVIKNLRIMRTSDEVEWGSGQKAARHIKGI